MPDGKLVEEWLPLQEVNLHSGLEMSFKLTAARFKNDFIRIHGITPLIIGAPTPLLRNIHPWPARRPCSLARVLTLAAILPHDFNKARFMDLVGLSDVLKLAKERILPVLFNAQPDREAVRKAILELYGKEPSEIIVVDPMAGGGAIPLEALRLGFKTIAMEYEPVAYLILKATLEYPAKYGLKLYEDVREEVKKFIEWAKENLGPYYAPDAMNYIFARGVRCPNPDCRGLVPVIHTNVLRGGRGPYIDIHADKEHKSFTVSISEVPTAFERLRCPYCGAPIPENYVFSEWVKAHKELLSIALKGNIEEARKAVEKLLEIHVLLVKQVRGGFVACSNEDRDAFIRAFLRLASSSKELKSFMPLDRIPEGNEVFKDVRAAGIERWYELFNPRQLLVLAELVRYVNNRIRELIDEKGEYGAAIGIYLALGISKLLNYNSIMSEWHASRGIISHVIGRYARGRKVGFGLDYCEARRIDLALSWIFEPDVEKPTATQGGILPILRQLCSWLEGLGDRVEVYMADARSLSSVLGERQVIDVVNIDPPYLDQHKYGDLSEYFWQVLRIALAPAIERGYFFNTDEKRGRVELLVPGWSPILSTVPREGEIISRSSAEQKALRNLLPPKRHTREWYIQEMGRVFAEIYKILKDDGVLIVWFTHSHPDAWEGILGALYAAGFSVSKVWTVRTEMATRAVAMGGTAFFSSLAIVVRKAKEPVLVPYTKPGLIKADEKLQDVIFSSVRDAYKSAKESGAQGWELFVMCLAGAIAGATRMVNPAAITLSKQITLTSKLEPEEAEELLRFWSQLKYFREVLYPAAVFLGSKWLLYDALYENLREPLKEAGYSEETLKKLIDDIIASDDPTKAYLHLWHITRWSAEPVVDYDFAEKLFKEIGITRSDLAYYGLINTRGKVKVFYGNEVFEALKRRLEIMNRTVAGRAILLTRLILEAPTRMDVSKAVEYVLSEMPVGKRDAAVALFLILTASDAELKKMKATEADVEFIKSVLKELLRR